jgi:hypothetical protein
LAGAFDVGHDGNLSDNRKREKFVLTLALILAFSPGEKELPAMLPVARMIVEIIPRWILPSDWAPLN